MYKIDSTFKIHFKVLRFKYFKHLTFDADLLCFTNKGIYKSRVKNMMIEGILKFPPPYLLNKAIQFNSRVAKFKILLLCFCFRTI